MPDSSPRSKRATETFTWQGDTIHIGDTFPIGHPATLAYGQFFREVPEWPRGDDSLTHSSVVGTRHDPDPMTRRDSDEPLTDRPSVMLTPEEINERSIRKAEEKANADLQEYQKTFGQGIEPTPEIERETQEDYEAQGGKVNTAGPDMETPSIPKNMKDDSEASKAQSDDKPSPASKSGRK